jgi:hypothetical protein
VRVAGWDVRVASHTARLRDFTKLTVIKKSTAT